MAWVANSIYVVAQNVSKVSNESAQEGIKSNFVICVSRMAIFPASHIQGQ